MTSYNRHYTELCYLVREILAIQLYLKELTG